MFIEIDENSSSGLGLADMPQSQINMTKAKIESFKGNDEDLNQIECYLETDDLWKKFHELGTEMIITKSGR